MVTLTLHDRDAVALLALLGTNQKNGLLQHENVTWQRIQGQLRCALLLCECAHPAQSQGFAL